jgi:hypothetical protein
MPSYMKWIALVAIAAVIFSGCVTPEPVSTPSVRFSPDTLDFGSLTCGLSKQMWLLLTNQGHDTVQVTPDGVSCPQFHFLTKQSQPIPPGGYVSIALGYQPLDATDDYCVDTVTIGVRTFTSVLHGRGVRFSPELLAAPSSVSLTLSGVLSTGDTTNYVLQFTSAIDSVASRPREYVFTYERQVGNIWDPLDHASETDSVWKANILVRVDSVLQVDSLYAHYQFSVSNRYSGVFEISERWLRAHGIPLQRDGNNLVANLAAPVLSKVVDGVSYSCYGPSDYPTFCQGNGMTVIAPVSFDASATLRLVIALPK